MALLLTVAIADVGVCQPAPNWLFEAVDGSSRTANGKARRVRSTRAVRELASQETLRVPLPGGKVVTVMRRRVLALSDEGVFWSGRLRDDPSASVHLVRRRGVLVGTVATADARYTIEYADADTQSVTRVDEGIRVCGGERVAAASAAGEPMVAAAQGTTTLAPVSGPAVDLLVVFTPAARIAAGGEDAIHATIELAVAVTNEALANSLVNGRIRLVGTREVAYAESRTLTSDLDRLTEPGDGLMDDVHAWRDAVGADLVSLMIERNSEDLEGLAWLMQQPSTTFASLAFSIVKRRTAATLTLAHEIGHNLGLSHDRANAGSPGVYPYAYGYRDPPYLRDVMAYACSGTTCPLIPHFSNPFVSYNGRPTGRIGTEDNARALQQTMLVAANFRRDTGPLLTQASPSTVPTLGGVRITLHGTRLSTVTRVLVGGRAATGALASTDGTLSVVVPRHPEGPADIEVARDDGERAVMLAGVRYVPSMTDVDGDALDDAWEHAMGLSGTNGHGDDGPDGDPDGDGLTNLAEREGHGHPRGYFRRYFAEGAASTYFSTQLALLNPGDARLGAVLRYLGGDGAVRSSWLEMPPLSRRTLAVADVLLASAGEFSLVIETDAPVVADRTMTWDVGGAGAHVETSVPAPSLRWLLAEGATTGGFNLFYLLQNPNAQHAEVRVRFLRAAGPPIERVYALPPTSRTNIWVNQEHFDGLGRALASAEVSADIEVLNGQSIVVERAMYLDRPGQSFGAGHASAGATAAREEWFLAEGATGAWFDMFVLVANPSSQPALLETTYLLPNGSTVIKSHVAPPLSRYTIWVDHEDARLADTAVATRVRVTNGVPVVVERSMWWLGTSTTWREAHNVVAAPRAASRWAVAEGEVGGLRDVETFLLVANTSPLPGDVTVTLLLEDGARLDRTFAIGPESRFNIDVRSEFPQARGRRFGALISASAERPLALVVERAMYWDAGGRRWAAGTAALATPLVP